MMDLLIDLKTDEDNMEHIASIISEETDTCMNLLKDKTRKQPIALNRQITLYFIKLQHPDISLKRIGKYFGNRDHSTVIHAIMTVNDLYVTNSKFRINLQNICNKVNPELLEKLGKVQRYERSML